MLLPKNSQATMARGPKSFKPFYDILVSQKAFILNMALKKVLQRITGCLILKRVILNGSEGKKS